VQTHLIMCHILSVVVLFFFLITGIIRFSLVKPLGFYGAVDERPC